MSRVQGYATLTDEKGVREFDTFTCAHCQRIVHIDKKEINFGQCAQCGPMKLICLPCTATGRCAPFEKQLEKMEATARFRKAAGL